MANKYTWVVMFQYYSDAWVEAAFTKRSYAERYIKKQSPERKLSLALYKVFVNNADETPEEITLG